MKPAALVPWILYAGLLVAMVGGAPWPHPNWLVVVGGVGVIVAGIVLKRRVEAGLVAEGEGGASRASDSESGEGLARLVASAKALAGDAQAGELAGLAARIEALQSGEIAPVANTQDDFVRRHGFPAWAVVMAPLATGERLLFRAWSAASDGHRGETVASIAQAIPYFEEADGALRAAKAAKR